MVRDGDWTRNVCGFWNVGLWSLLLRASQPDMSFGQWYKEFNKRVRRLGFSFQFLVWVIIVASEGLPASCADCRIPAAAYNTADVL